MAKMKQKKGIAMAMALTFMTALMITGIPQFKKSVVSTKAAQRMYNTERAFWLAEAGIHEARFAIANDALGVAPWTRAGNVYSLGLDVGDDTYSVTVTKIADDYAINSNGSIQAYGVNNAYVKNLSLNAQSAVQGTPVFTYAAHAYGDVTVLNGTTITGNVAAGGTVNIPVSGTINGDMTAAGGLNMGQWASGGVTGADDGVYAEEALEEVELPAGFPTPTSRISNTAWDTWITIGPGKLACTGLDANNGGGVRIKNNTEIYIDGDLNVKNGKLMVISGTATIYITGNIVTTNDGMLNSNGDAKLVIFGIGGDDQTIEVKGNSSASNVAIFAPEASVTVTNSGGVNGSVVAGSITVSGAGGIEYDADVSGTTVVGNAGPTTTVFSDWTES